MNYLCTCRGRWRACHLNQCTKRFTTPPKVNIQMEREKEEKEAFLFLPECVQYVWIRIEANNSEIAPFHCTSVYFESISLAFLHFTWWLHRFLRGAEYISESGCSTGFLSARKPQLVREGRHLTTDLWSYLVWICLQAKHSGYVHSNVVTIMTVITLWRTTTPKICLFVGFAASGERAKAYVHSLRGRCRLLAELLHTVREEPCEKCKTLLTGYYPAQDVTTINLCKIEGFVFFGVFFNKFKNWLRFILKNAVKMCP